MWTKPNIGSVEGWFYRGLVLLRVGSAEWWLY